MVTQIQRSSFKNIVQILTRSKNCRTSCAFRNFILNAFITNEHEVYEHEVYEAYEHEVYEVYGHEMYEVYEVYEHEVYAFWDIENANNTTHNI